MTTALVSSKEVKDLFMYHKLITTTVNRCKFSLIYATASLILTAMTLPT